MEEIRMHQRLKYIDFAKGIAILLVVMGHVLCFLFYGESRCGESGLFQIISGFHMPLFMFLSGIVASFGEASITFVVKDTYKRFHSLIVPFLFFGILYSFVIGNHDAELFLSNMKLGYWYLFVLFELYLMRDFILLLSRISNRWYFVLCYALVGYVFLKFSKTLFPYEVSSAFSLEQLSSYYPYFMCGLLLNRYHLRESIFSNHWTLLITLPLVPVLYWLASAGVPVCGKLWLICLCFTILSAIYLIVDGRNSGLIDSISGIGKNTLMIYVVHYFVLQLFDLSFVGDFIMSNYSLGGNWFLLF